MQIKINFLTITASSIMKTSKIPRKMYHSLLIEVHLRISKLLFSFMQIIIEKTFKLRHFDLIRSSTNIIKSICLHKCMYICLFIDMRFFKSESCLKLILAFLVLLSKQWVSNVHRGSWNSFFTTYLAFRFYQFSKYVKYYINSLYLYI